MANLLEQMLPGVMSDGLQTNKAVVLGSTLNVTGAVVLSSTLNVTGLITAPQQYNVIQSALVGATVQLTTAQSDSICINRSTSGSPSWTLPASAPAGIAFTFVTANTTAGFTITSATQVVHAKTSATGTAITSTTTITNTQGTAVVGDTLTIVCDGTAWWMTAQSGIFAAS